MIPSAGEPLEAFMRRRLAGGAFPTEDVLACVLPLFKQTVEAHASGRVAPLEGLADLFVSDGAAWFRQDRLSQGRSDPGAIQRLDRPASRALDVRAEETRETDVDRGTPSWETQLVGKPGEAPSKPIFMTGYTSWEHAAGHHDALTDSFSLGMILASVACGLDFREPDDLKRFVACRENLFALRPQINPVVAKAVVRMTELSRHRRAQDLPAILRRLENYREQDEEDRDLDTRRIRGFQKMDVRGKRRAVLTRLRDRIFEISRRNRLLYHRPSLQSLNLTFASVPASFDVASIRPEQLFTWKGEVEALLSEGKPVSLGKYLRFEDVPYIPDVLDKLIGEARRDQAEFGFAQLKLVICFLRWHNLKENPEERIDSPLLLLPVRLVKKKGVRDAYVMEPGSTIAEVNPVLRHHLKQLYGIDLPVALDLADAKVGTLHEYLAAKIQASEPGVSVNRIDRPQVEMITDRAKKRMDQYQRRLRLGGAAVRSFGDLDYSYDRLNFQPLGLRLFEAKVRPAPAALRDFVEAPRPTWSHVAGPERAPASSDKERRVAAFRDGGAVNPYSWDFDLCSLTLGNFRYRKMSLVRDFETLLQEDLPSPSFDSVFTLAPRAPAGDPPPALPLDDQFPVVPCDPTQSSAVALARTGRSFIIQGPPGTGKSQTITNLIADFVARGKRVLFVCEKRAALDVVYHRLKQQGLDGLCSLIHDSQQDKKEFILDLKKTYEEALKPAEGRDAEAQRGRCVSCMGQELEPLRKYDEIMRSVPPSAGISVGMLLHRRAEVRDQVPPLNAVERERMPAYRFWAENREAVGRLAVAIRDLQPDGVLANHPLRLLSPQVAKEERPIEAAMRNLAQARATLETVEGSLRGTGLPQDQWDEYSEAVDLVNYAVLVRPLAERGLMVLLVRESGASRDFAAVLAGQMKLRQASLDAALAAAKGWREKLPRADAQAALEQARVLEMAWLPWLKPAWWRLRRILNERYDFKRHLVPPAWTRILETLEAEYAAAEAYTAGEAKFREVYGGGGDSEVFAKALDETRSYVERLRGPARALHDRSLADSGAAKAVLSVAAVQDGLGRLRGELDRVFSGYEALKFPELRAEFDRVQARLEDLPDFLPLLADLGNLPPPLAALLRRAPFPPDRVEAAMAERTVHEVIHGDRFLVGFGGPLRDRHLKRLEAHYERWLEGNAACVVDRVHRAFRKKVSVSSLPVSQLAADQKAFKQAYSAGRRDLEHEFGKTMRYRSIRELLAKESGEVILDLKPVWLMSPLSVSDTLPIDVERFDVVIFDEASQIPVEDAIPSIFRGPQIVVVGDEMQLPPTNFFSAKQAEEEGLVIEEGEEAREYDLDSDSFLNHACKNLASTMLGWHYRSRSEALISFSNAAFYQGGLLTVPDRRSSGEGGEELGADAPQEGAANLDKLLARSLSFHFMRQGVYENRRNATEAGYIAETVRELLRRKSGLTIGVIAFSEAQQEEIEKALAALGRKDAEFAALLEAEVEREEEGQFVGLLVKNLENIQGDERDLVILSICYGRGPDGRMLMTFGPINQSGGEKRLNVAFSRAKRHMAVVSSIKAPDVKNVYNDGANCLRNYLQYAESVSRGDGAGAKRVLASAGPEGEMAAAADRVEAAVVGQLASELRARGWEVDGGVGQSKFRCDLAVRKRGESFYRAAIDVDTPGWYEQADVLERDLLKPRVLRAFDWRVCHVLVKDWVQDPKAVLDRVEKVLEGAEPEMEDPWEEVEFQEVEPAKPKLVETAVFSVDTEGVSKRHFEFVGGGSSKFWEITVNGPQLSVRFGRIGTAGQTQVKNLADAAAAAKAADKLVREKSAKGYKEKR